MKQSKHARNVMLKYPYMSKVAIIVLHIRPIVDTCSIRLRTGNIAIQGYCIPLKATLDIHHSKSFRACLVCVQKAKALYLKS